MIRGGQHVLYIDQENGDEIIAERLTILGISPETVEAFFHYEPFPAKLPQKDQLRARSRRCGNALAERACDRGLGASFMTRYELNPNVEVYVEQFYGALMGAVKATKALTVVVIDHSNRKTTENDEHSAAGSAAKNAAVDAVCSTTSSASPTSPRTWRARSRSRSSMTGADGCATLRGRTASADRVQGKRDPFSAHGRGRAWGVPQDQEGS